MYLTERLKRSLPRSSSVSIGVHPWFRLHCYGFDAPGPKPNRFLCLNASGLAPTYLEAPTPVAGGGPVLLKRWMRSNAVCASRFTVASVSF